MQPDHPRVAVVYGSHSENEVMSRVGGMLSRFGVGYEETVLSPHRSPRALANWCAELEPRGIEVVVAGGGRDAALAGIVAALVAIPVVGLPLHGGPMGGMDALLAMTQLAAGVPVATVGVDNHANAAILAVQFLAVGDPRLRAELARLKHTFEEAAVF